MALSSGSRRTASELRIGGVRAQELAAAYGTPLLALDYDVLDAAIAEFLAACEPHRIEIAYSGKALLLVSLARHLKHTPLRLDVSSLGELAAAERAAFPPDRLTLHGCGKTREELQAAAAGRVGRIVVDNIEELERFTALANPASASLLLRLNTGIEAQTHRAVHTSGESSKFGFDPDALPGALAWLRKAANLRFIGLHSHVGSQIFAQDAFAANARALMERAAYCTNAGLTVTQIVAGGGFGVVMRPDEPALDVEKTMTAIAAAVRKEAQRWNIAAPAIGIEPGRALIAQAGTSLYTVMAVKREFGTPYVIVDGGVYENPRPAMYGAYHHLLAAQEGESTVETIVCGRTCENDRLGTAWLPSTLRAGDLLAMRSTGAYTYSMAGNYNRFARPAVVAVRQGTHAPIARRETLEDLLKTDIDA